MKDIEARGVVLQFLYERRREGYFPKRDESPIFQEHGTDEFYRICGQLSEVGLIAWEKLMVPSEAGGWKNRATSIKITAAGVDAVESGGRNSPIPITFQHIVIQNSTGVQVGDHNSQSVAVSINQILRSIEEADAPAEAKAEAKGRLRALLEHPLVAALAGAGASALFGG